MPAAAVSGMIEVRGFSAEARRAPSTMLRMVPLPQWGRIRAAMTKL
jgi:hypothetical protein